LALRCAVISAAGRQRATGLTSAKISQAWMSVSAASAASTSASVMSLFRFVKPVTTASGTSTSGFGVGVGDAVGLGADEVAGLLASGGGEVGVAWVVVQAARRTSAAAAAEARGVRIGADGSG
jgi:hypothetical protein